MKQLPKLWYLNFHRTLITNDALKHLSEMTALEYLDLSRTAINDDGLSILQNTSLVYINLRDTESTVASRQRLRQALEECQIYPQP